MPRVTHGLTRQYARPPEYNAWRAMKARCTNPKRDNYHLYGGRGIVVAPEWRHDFAAFFAYVGPRPSPQHTIDRIDNDGPYAPGNVRWATAQEQRRNSRTTHWVTHEGVTRSLHDWAQHLGVPYARLQKRVLRGWDTARVLTVPRQRAGRPARLACAPTP